MLDCSPLPWVPLDTFPAPEARSRTLRLPVWLALDEVTDPVWAPGCQSLFLTTRSPLQMPSSSPLLESFLTNCLISQAAALLGVVPSLPSQG